MSELKKIASRLALLALVLVGLNFVYTHFFYRADLETHTPVMLQVDAASDSAQVVYLGESSNFTFEDTDADKRSISQFAGGFFPSLKWGTVQKGALHAGNYYSLLRNIPRSSSVKTVVVTLNLRSFNATWINSKLETSLQKSMVLTRPGPTLWRRFLLGFRAYEIKTAEERKAIAKASWATADLGPNSPYPNVITWDSAMAEIGIHMPNGKRHNANTVLATQYIKTYAFRIDTLTNPRIGDFDRIVDLCQDRDWNLVFLLLPENMEKANELVPELPVFMKENRDLLVNRYRSKGATVVDLLELLPNKIFSDQNWTTEHYNESGRKLVAQNLAESVKPFHPREFKEVVYTQVLQSVFTNDCEGQEIWVQMGSLSDDRAHSGEKSSRIGNKKPFSLTFTRAIPDLDSALLDSVAISFWYYQQDSSNEGLIALEAGGDETGNLFSPNPIKDYTNTFNEWTKVEAKFSLWAVLPQAEVLKIYIHNPSNSLVWVDDIRIEFLGEKNHQSLE